MRPRLCLQLKPQVVNILQFSGTDAPDSHATELAQDCTTHHKNVIFKNVKTLTLTLSPTSYAVVRPVLEEGVEVEANGSVDGEKALEERVAGWGLALVPSGRRPAEVWPALRDS